MALHLAKPKGRPQSPALLAVQAAIDQYGDLTLRDIMHHARVLVGAHEQRLNCREARAALSNGLRACPPVFEKVGAEKRPHAKRWCVLYGLVLRTEPELGAFDAAADDAAAGAGSGLGLADAMGAFWGGHAR